MIDFSAVWTGAQMLVAWDIMMVIVFGIAFGILTGAIPGFSSPMAMIVMLPYSYTMRPITGVVFMGAIFLGSCFGGSVSSILLNIPGTPQAIATCLDGFPMTRQGKANLALGLALGASTYGSLLGTIVLLFIMKPLGSFAIQFGAAEMFMVIVMGLTILSSLSTGNILRGLIAGCFGILLGTIGTTFSGRPRGTFGLVELMDGIPLMATLIGFVAIPEIFSLLNNSMESGSVASFKADMAEIWRGVRQGMSSVFNNLRSSVIGIIIGILPGAGGMFATIVAYNETKKAAKNPESFGKGNPEGVIAAETANNASQGGSYAILMALGIPGGSATAVLYGALLVHNYVPGPRFVGSNMDFCYAITLSLFLCTLAMLVLGAFMCHRMASVLRVPLMILLPLLIVFSLVGTYVDSKVYGHLWIMIILGVVGFVLKSRDYPVMSVVLGIILGGMAETYYVRSLQTFDSLGEVFARPIFLALFVITVFSVVAPPIMARFKKKALFSLDES